MDKPLVSIIIPIYNSEKHLSETIESTLNQSWSSKEIILVDDGSNDNSLNIARGYESDHVKVFSQQNKGASAARNKGLIEANGDYIQFLDGDDLLKEDKIELQLNAIRDEPRAMAYGPYANFSGNDIDSVEAKSYLEANYSNGKDFLYDLYGGSNTKHIGSMVPLHSWLTPASVIKDARGWNENITVDDDGEFFCRVVLKASAVVYVSGAVCYYRMHQHSKNLSAQKSYQSYLSGFNAVKLKHRHIGDDKRFNPLLANQTIQILNGVYPDHPELCREIEKFIDSLGGNNWEPYQEGGHKVLRQLFGWKAVKLLSYYKNKLVAKH